MLKETLLNLRIVVNNDYLDKYCNIISNNLDTPHVKYKTQKHHIIPKAYYTWQKLPIDNSPGNLVNLNAKDHVLAHYYLALCSANTDFKYINELAFTYLTNKKYCDVTESELLKSLPHYQEMYEEMCKQRGLKNKGRKFTEEQREHCRQAQKGRIYKQEWKDTRKKNWKPEDHLRTAEQKEYQSQQIKGRKHITNGIEEKLLPAIDCLPYIESGWYYGSLTKGRAKSPAFREKISKALKGKSKTAEHKLAASKAKMGRIAITNGIIDKVIKPEDLALYEQLGYRKGKVNTDYSFTRRPDRIQKIREKNQGRIHVNNGVEARMIRAEELQQYLDAGYSLGRIYKRSKRDK